MVEQNTTQLINTELGLIQVEFTETYSRLNLIRYCGRKVGSEDDRVYCFFENEIINIELTN